MRLASVRALAPWVALAIAGSAVVSASRTRADEHGQEIAPFVGLGPGELARVTLAIRVMSGDAPHTAVSFAVQPDSSLDLRGTGMLRVSAVRMSRLVGAVVAGTGMLQGESVPGHGAMVAMYRSDPTRHVQRFVRLLTDDEAALLFQRLDIAVAADSLSRDAVGELACAMARGSDPRVTAAHPVSWEIALDASTPVLDAASRQWTSVVTIHNHDRRLPGPLWLVVEPREPAVVVNGVRLMPVGSNRAAPCLLLWGIPQLVRGAKLRQFLRLESDVAPHMRLSLWEAAEAANSNP